MKTLVTAQLSAHQSAGDVIGCVNGAGVMCCGRSMAQQSTSQKSATTVTSLTSICLRAACSLFPNMLMTLKKKNANRAEWEALIILFLCQNTSRANIFFSMTVCRSVHHTDTQRASFISIYF